MPPSFMFGIGALCCFSALFDIHEAGEPSTCVYGMCSLLTSCSALLQRHFEEWVETRLVRLTLVAQNGLFQLRFSRVL
jgi:hypothetical protein